VPYPKAPKTAAKAKAWTGWFQLMGLRVTETKRWRQPKAAPIMNQIVKVSLQRTSFKGSHPPRIAAWVNAPRF
jgi:hypothetical protein